MANTLKMTIQQSTSDFEEIARRHSALETQLMDAGMSVTDVRSDGNCFFRAASIILHDTESRHASLRELVAAHIQRLGSLLGGIVDVSPDDGQSFEAHFQALRTGGTAVGEDAIAALAAVSGRDVMVYIAYTEPQVYKCQSSSSNEPLRLAFFEPGHYMAVRPIITSTHIAPPANNLNESDSFLIEDF